MNFPFGTNGKFIILGVPILKHIRVFALDSFLVYKMFVLGSFVAHNVPTCHISIVV